MWGSRAFALLTSISLAGCEVGQGSPTPPLDLGDPLGASAADPILLTFAAARERTSYLVDEGYTLTWDEAGVASFSTDTSGDLGIAFEVDGYIYTSEFDLAAPSRIDHTTSDGAVIRLDLGGELTVEVRLLVSTSRAASIEVWIENAARVDRDVSVMPWLRRCGGAFTGVARAPSGITARHHAEPDPLLAIFGPGTFTIDAADALVTDGPAPTPLGLAACSDKANDAALLLSELPSPPAEAEVIALRADRLVPARTSAHVRIERAVVDASSAADLPSEIALASEQDIAARLREGVARLDAAPKLHGLDRRDALAYRSAFTLLDQVMMPKEGKLGHDYYVFSREPTWWFARLGQNVHESLAMLALAKMRPELAVASHRVFIDRIESDGYLPYSVGPVIDRTDAGTAAAPLFSFVAWEIYQSSADQAFLADAYAAGKKLYAFWSEQRDVDQDGLAEWGGFAVTESLRDLHNVVWEEVAPPELLEAVDLNAMLVVEAHSLAAMADALGEAAEAQAFRDASDARADRMNAIMWDDETGFYYHVTRDGESFSYAKQGDLKRMEIAGLLPLWAGIVPDDRRAKLLAHLADPSRFFRAYGIPGLSASDPSYDPGATSCCRWNGPVWVPWQLLVTRGLYAYGERELARAIALRAHEAVTLELARSHQFRELYDPDDAAPRNDSEPNYLWSAMSALLLLEASE